MKDPPVDHTFLESLSDIPECFLIYPTSFPRRIQQLRFDKEDHSQ